MKVNKGDILYTCDTSLEGKDCPFQECGHCEDGSEICYGYKPINIIFSEYVCTSVLLKKTVSRKYGSCSLKTRLDPINIKFKIATVIKKIKGVTWVKRSKKQFDYGWSNYISKDYKYKVLVDKETQKLEKNIHGFSKSKMGAMRIALSENKRILKRGYYLTPHNPLELEARKRIASVIKRLESKLI